MSSYPPSYPPGPRQDSVGNIYWTPGSGPAPDGTVVKVQTDRGTETGRLVGGLVIRDKPSK